MVNLIAAKSVSPVKTPSQRRKVNKPWHSTPDTRRNCHVSLLIHIPRHAHHQRENLRRYLLHRWCVLRLPSEFDLITLLQLPHSPFSSSSPATSSSNRQSTPSKLPFILRLLHHKFPLQIQFSQNTSASLQATASTINTSQATDRRVDGRKPHTCNWREDMSKFVVLLWGSHDWRKRRVWRRELSCIRGNGT